MKCAEYRWKSGMDFRWFASTRRVRAGGLRHILKQSDGTGYFEALCGNYMLMARLAEDPEGNPCKKCLEKASQYQPHTRL